MIGQMFNLNAQLVIPIGIPTNKANAEIKTQPLTAETNKKKVESNL